MQGEEEAKTLEHGITNLLEEHPLSIENAEEWLGFCNRLKIFLNEISKEAVELIDETSEVYTAGSIDDPHYR